MATDPSSETVTKVEDSDLWVSLALASVVALVLLFLLTFPERRSVELPKFSPRPRMLDVAAVRSTNTP